MRPVHCCTDCDGRGGAHVEEPGEPTSWWRCEGCGGSGETTSCRDCGDPMSRPDADADGWRCALCRDAEDRAAREMSLQRRFA